MKPCPEAGETAGQYPQKPRLLLGVDGGGSRTAAAVAALDNDGRMQVLGRGRGGPSNLRLAGKAQSLASLDQAVDEALAAARLVDQTVDCAVLALAGSALEDVQNEVLSWAKMRKLALDVEITRDTAPVLASGTAHGWGVALIVGTGSVAIGIDAAGQSVTMGGWGHWFGDKGSGFDLGRKALEAVAEADDGLGPRTELAALVLENFGIRNPRRILQEMSASGEVRRQVAALAPIVLGAADRNDAVARSILNGAVNETAKLVAAVVGKLTFTEPFPLALAGGVVCGSRLFRAKLIARLDALQPGPGVINVVDNPVNGCLEIARRKSRAEQNPHS